MRINRLHIGSKITETVGITEIKLDRLGPIVALIGKNGSGKSRILDLLEKWYLEKLNYEDFFTGDITNVPAIIEELVNRVNSIKEEIEIIKKEIKFLGGLSSHYESSKPKRNSTPSRAQRYKDLVAQPTDLQNKINVHQSLAVKKIELDKKINLLLKKYFHRIRYSEIRNLRTVLENASSDKKSLTFEELMDAVSQQDEYSELDAIYMTGLTYLTKLPNQILDDFIGTLGDSENFEKTQSRKRFLILAKFVETFLNKKLEWDRKEIQKKITADGVVTTSQGLWKLDNRIFNYNELSEGEKTLFAYSLLFFLLGQNSRLRIQESIIIIDEPELHLHPESEFKVIEKISELVRENGQLWIATHSLPILSNLSHDEIFLVKSGSIITPSRITPEQSLIELMGIEGHIEKLSQFVTNISNWAFLNFMTQCFNDPEAIKCAQEKDPQFEVFKNSIKGKENNSILLDFGAGQGRIYREIAKDEQLMKKIKYSALEPIAKNIDELKKLNIPIYESYLEIPEGKFDYILLCNVLHEISISKWKIILNKIKSALTKTGFLIIIEDLKLPKGEKINEAGFLVMDIQSLAKLFSLNIPPLQLLPDNVNHKERILCAVISKSSMNDITDYSILESLLQLMNNSLEKIKNLRSTPITTENKLILGRESAFYSQLYINSLLASEVFSSSMESTFKGGEKAWRKYLEKNLDSNIPVKNGAPVGQYTVDVLFTVSPDGAINGVNAITNHGFGMEAEAVRVIEKAPKWEPAMQNGNKVNARRKQPITFRVTEE